MSKQCVLYERICIDCGECNQCDIDASKICDNCGACLQSNAEASEILIDDIVDGDENALPGDLDIDHSELEEAWKAFRIRSGWKD